MCVCVDFFKKYINHNKYVEDYVIGIILYLSKARRKTSFLLSFGDLLHKKFMASH